MKMLFLPYFVDAEKDADIQRAFKLTAELFGELKELCNILGAGFAIVTVGLLKKSANG
jgi:hypothetical protein